MQENFENYEIVIVDDGSVDNTSIAIGKLLGELECLRIIRLSRSCGWEIAVAAGLDGIIGDFAVIIEPWTDPVNLIPELVFRCRSGEDILTGVPEGDEFIRPKGFARKLFHWYLAKYSGLVLVPNSTGFQVFSRQVVNAIIKYHEKNRKIRLLCAMTGYKNSIFSYNPCGERTRPNTGVKDAVDIIIGNTIHPLRFVSRLGLVICVINFIYLAYIIIIYLFKKNVMEGWTTISFFNATMFFFLFLFLSILGEYIGKLLEESTDRPPYVIEEERNSSVLYSHGPARNVLHKSE